MVPHIPFYRPAWCTRLCAMEALPTLLHEFPKGEYLGKLFIMDFPETFTLTDKLHQIHVKADGAFKPDADTNGDDMKLRGCNEI